MPLSSAGLNQMAKKIQAMSDGLSLHDDVPGDLAENELSGGSYVRRGAPISYEDNVATLSSPQSFAVPPNVTVKYVGLWQDKNSVDPATDFLGYWAVENVTYGPLGGIYTVTAGTFTATTTDS